METKQNPSEIDEYPGEPSPASEKDSSPLIPTINTRLVAYDLETSGVLTFVIDNEGKITQMDLSYPTGDPRDFRLKANGFQVGVAKAFTGGGSNGF